MACVPGMTLERNRKGWSGLWDQNTDGHRESMEPKGRDSLPQDLSFAGRKRDHPRGGDSIQIFAESCGSANDGAPVYSVDQRPAARQTVEEVASQMAETEQQLSGISGAAGSVEISRAQHVNTVTGGRPPSSSNTYTRAKTISLAAPANLRTKPWSPPPLSASKLPTRTLSDRGLLSSGSDYVRRDSVPDRSPLQKLEGKLDDIVKEEKRARIEQAENKARSQNMTGASIEKLLPLPSGEAEGTAQSIRDLPGDARRVVADKSLSTSTGVHRRRSSHQASAGAQLPANTSTRFSQTSSAGHGLLSNHSLNRSFDIQINASSSQEYNAKKSAFTGTADAIAVRGDPMVVAALPSAAERGKEAYKRHRNKERLTQSDSSRLPALSIGRLNSKGQSAGLSDIGTRNLHRERVDARKVEIHAATDDSHSDVYRYGSGDERQIDSRAQPEISSRSASGTQTWQHVELKDPQSMHATTDAYPLVSSHRFRDLLHRQRNNDIESRQDRQPLTEWRSAAIARLTAHETTIETSGHSFPSIDTAQTDNPNNTAAWWEKSARERERERRHHKFSSSTPRAMPQYDGPYKEEAQNFRPQLFLKCGPLLRFTGIRHDKVSSDRPQANVPDMKEVWRGSIMIVTEDDQSDYSTVPSLRIFAQPMDLLQPHFHDDDQNIPHEDDDPIAGQVKLSRTGRPLYVRPVHEIDGQIDLSREENNRGLYSASRALVVGPTESASTAPGTPRQHIKIAGGTRIQKRDGEKLGKYKDIKGARLHAERGFTFWRFSVEIELASTQRRIAYRINCGPAIGFWVPARGETMNAMFHSCNGFSLSVDSAEFSGPDPLWRDVLNKHQRHPFHVMLGGGDQVYNDASMRHTELFREWLQIKNPQAKHKFPFSPELQDELEWFFLDRYAMWFSQGLFAMANSQIPMVNVWDDHDIIDGFGSYPPHFMSSKVFTGLGAIAFRYYMLFQHQSLAAETNEKEPSWLLGATPGPYINELSRSLFMWLGGGKKLAYLGLDCRTERMRGEILSQESYDIVFNRLRQEIVKGTTKHLVVLLGVPIAYPRLNFLENILTSRLMDPLKALGRTGMLGGFVNKFDGGVEILDDLDDHWTAKHHKAERNWFIQELQALAAEKSVRVTILGGDVHLGAVGQFYSSKRLKIPKDRDHRYMPNVISSAIVNTPSPPIMADVLNKRNKTHHLDAETDEDMIPMFPTDVDHTKRNNVHLLPRRNYATIKEYMPGSTPPSTPPSDVQLDGGRSNLDAGTVQYIEDGRPGRSQHINRRHPPSSIKRSESLTRRMGTLVRRLSGSGKGKTSPVSLAHEHARPYSSLGYGQAPSTAIQQSHSMNSPNPRYESQRPNSNFLRRPTTLSKRDGQQRDNKKGGYDGNLDGDEIDLEGGLDIALNMEIDQKDPGGKTVSYRLLIPALWYSAVDVSNARSFAPRRRSIRDRLRGIGGATLSIPRSDQYLNDLSDERSRTSTDVTRTPSPRPDSGGSYTTGAGYGSQAIAATHTRVDGQIDTITTPQTQRAPAKARGDADVKAQTTFEPPLGSKAQTFRAASSGGVQNYGVPLRGGMRQFSLPGSLDPARIPDALYVPSVQGLPDRGPVDYQGLADDIDNRSQDGANEDRPSSECEREAQAESLPRRQSKAEKFFGIGPGDDRHASSYGGHVYRGQQHRALRNPGIQGRDSHHQHGNRPKWMVWR